ncbi:MAG TPA: 2'-5' RNA ligase family protein, partial [Rectinemataceae bacterium]|nr:2'-5' RNA ligase family protein [Rectinemataceae bacterium]
MHRTFLAIDFSESFKRQMGEYTRALCPSFAGRRLSWVDPRIFHLTLHFFGDIDDSGISALKDRFSAIAGSISPPCFRVAGLA